MTGGLRAPYTLCSGQNNLGNLEWVQRRALPTRTSTPIPNQNDLAFFTPPPSFEILCLQGNSHRARCSVFSFTAAIRSRSDASAQRCQAQQGAAGRHRAPDPHTVSLANSPQVPNITSSTQIGSSTCTKCCCKNTFRMRGATVVGRFAHHEQRRWIVSTFRIA
eukprot:6187410-Prymnesium_polylepis.2